MGPWRLPYGTGRSRPTLRCRAEQRVAATRDVLGFTADLHHLVPACRPGYKDDVPAPHAKGPGHRPQRRLGRLAVDGPRGDGHHEGVAMPAADKCPRRAGLDAYGYPHAPTGTLTGSRIAPALAAASRR